MSASPVACGNCGAPLNVPASVSFATCAHCGSQLRIQRDGGAVYSELRKDVQGVAEAVQRLEGHAERNAAASEQVAREVRIQRLEMQRASTRETIAQLNVRLADKLAELARRGTGGSAVDQLTAGCFLATGLCAGFVAVIAMSSNSVTAAAVFGSRRRRRVMAKTIDGMPTTDDDQERRARKRRELVIIGQLGVAILGVTSCVWVSLLGTADATHPWKLADYGSFGDAVAPLTAFGTLLALGLGYWGLIYQREDIDEQLREVSASRRAQEELAAKQVELVAAERATAEAIAQQANVMREQLEELREFNSKILAANLDLAQQQARAAAALTRAAELQERAAAAQERERLLEVKERERVQLEALREDAHSLQARIDTAKGHWTVRLVHAADREYGRAREDPAFEPPSRGLVLAQELSTQLTADAAELPGAIAAVSGWLTVLATESHDQALFSRDDVFVLRRRLLAIHERFKAMAELVARWETTGRMDPPDDPPHRETF